MERDSQIQVIFAPDWRDANSYQAHLSQALEQLGAEVFFLRDYRRILPLYRGLEAFPKQALLHLHWPNPYLGLPGQWGSRIRRLRFPWDLKLATFSRPMVITAHNTFPHNLERTRSLKYVIQQMYRRADRVIVHSSAAADQLIREFRLDPGFIKLIRHGEVTELIEDLPDRSRSRHQLKLQDEAQCVLVFGAVSPYKGIEELIDFWNANPLQATLLIVGRPSSDDYGVQIASKAAKNERIRLRLEFVSNDELKMWICASDCCLFNYREILTSGSVHPPRALGIPILLPARLRTLELDEPNPRVLRFSSLEELPQRIQEACEIGTNYGSARGWREAHDWNTIAQETFDLYRELQ